MKLTVLLTRATNVIAQGLTLKRNAAVLHVVCDINSVLKH